MKTNRKNVRAVCAMIGAGFLAVVSNFAFADAKVESAARNVESAAADVNAVIAGMNNAATAKTAQDKLQAALKKFYAADDAFSAAVRVANPKTAAEGKAFEAAMEKYQKANEMVADAKVKALSRADIAGEVGTAMKATEPKAGAVKANKE